MDSRHEAGLVRSRGSVTLLTYHVVFATKYRRRVITARVLELLAGSMEEACRIKGWTLREFNGEADHVHLLCLLSRKYAIKDVVEEAKTETTKWLKKQSPRLADFHWQSGYGIFSVSESNAEPVKRYIARQEEHHRQMSFQDEFRQLCQRHGVDVDERYVWD